MNDLFEPCRIHICAAAILRHLKTSHFPPGYHNSGQCQIYLTKRRDVLTPLSTSINNRQLVSWYTGLLFSNLMKGNTWDKNNSKWPSLTENVSYIKITKEPKQNSPLGTASNKITWGGG